MKWVVYNLLFSLAFPLMLPAFLARMLRRGGYGARLLDRFALYPKGVFGDAKDGAGRFVWVHAVSVGEVQVAGQLMREWRKAEPGVRFCFSTTSSTGWKMAEREVAEGDVLIYNPLDFPTFVKAALNTVRPRAVVLVESEIWPNFIRAAKRRGVPVYLVNARVSDRSAPRYRLAKWWFSDVFRSFAGIFAQSELDKARLVAAGADPATVEVSGSFKFDVAHRNEAKEREMSAWLENGGVPKGERILLGGSTWPGEDQMLLNVVKGLEGVTLVIAPRHFEKADAVEDNIRAAGFECVRRSRADAPAAPQSPSSRRVFLADTTGELMGLYGIADVVFVGKSVCAHGSQNMIEPCLCGKPTVVGPYTENFRPVMSDLLEAHGVIQAQDADGVEDALRRLLTKGDGGLGSRAHAAVVRRTGVVGRCVAAMRGALAAAPAGRDPFAKRTQRSAFAPIVGLALPLLVVAVAFIMADSALNRRISATAAAKARPERKPIEERPLPKLRAVRVAGAYIAMMERPDALKVRLVGSDAQGYRQFFEGAGLKCWDDANPGRDGALFDIVFAGGDVGVDGVGRLASLASERGEMAWAIDVHKMSAAEFKAALETFPSEDAHFWMPGERDWMITGRKTRRIVKMSAVLDFFSRENVITKEAEEAGCCSMQEVFANYVGTRDDVMGAFGAGDLSAKVSPGAFVSTHTPDIAWIVPDGMDADIVESLAAQIRRLQDVRRRIIKAGMRYAEKGGAGEAVDAWAAALRENPRDVMLLDRLYMMAVNARAFKSIGNLQAAKECYEAMVAIRPNDAGIVDEYAQMLQALGKRDMAAKVHRKAVEIRSGGRVDGGGGSCHSGPASAFNDSGGKDCKGDAGRKAEAQAKQNPEKQESAKNESERRKTDEKGK